MWKGETTIKGTFNRHPAFQLVDEQEPRSRQARIRPM